MEKPLIGIYLIDSLTLGGAQRQLVELVKNLDRTIIKPIVVVYHDLPFYLDELNKCGIETHLFKKYDKLGIGFIARFCSFLRKIKPDFIHSFLNTPNLYARLAKLFGATRKVITSERSLSIIASNKLVLIERMTCYLSDCIITNAEAIKRELVERLGILENKIYVVHNGIDAIHFDEFNPVKVQQIRDTMQISSKGMIIGLIARLEKRKNHLGFLDAINQIKTYHPELEIKIGFWGSELELKYSEEVRERCVQYEIEKDVFFWGPERDMASVYGACDLIVQPSLFEGFPNVVIEAMAATKVVIASDVADNAYIIQEGLTGFLVPPNSPEILASKIVEVLSIPKADRVIIGKRARQHVVQNYSVENMISNTMEVYRGLNLY